MMDAGWETVTAHHRPPRVERSVPRVIRRRAARWSWRAHHAGVTALAKERRHLSIARVVSNTGAGRCLHSATNTSVRVSPVVGSGS